MWHVLWGSKISNINSVVFGIGAVFLWFVVNQCFHVDGDKGIPIAIVVFIDMCICQ